MTSTDSKSIQTNARGRPIKGQADARLQLVLAARRCFARHAYRDVTTRMLAAEAGVNASLIRYYFLNKDGLYQQMLSHVAEEFQQTLTRMTEQNPDNPFEAIFRTHMNLAQHNPDIPKLIFREMAFNDGHNRQQVIDNVGKPNQKFIESLFAKFFKQHHLKQGFDPLILLLSTFSISIIPHLLSESFEQMVGIKLDAELTEKMIWQNSQMLQFGCLDKQNSEVQDS